MNLRRSTPCDWRATFLLPALLLLGAFPAPSAAQEKPAPLPCPAPEARQFDFWIGDWSVENRNPTGPNHWVTTGYATDRVYAVVGGCAIVEHWRGEALGGPTPIVGYSIRAWDPEAESWRLVLRWPMDPESVGFFELDGRFRHGRGEFERRAVNPATGDSVVTRYTFSDASADRLRWHLQRSTDGGQSWIANWIMEFSRRDPVRDGGLMNGITATNGRCPDEPNRALDAHLGSWRGVHIAGSDTTRVWGHVLPILEGCAVQEQLYADDGSWEWYGVRGWVTQADAWVGYRLSTDEPRLRLEQAAPGDATRYVGADGARRTTWTRLDDGRLHLLLEAQDADGQWTEQARVELRPWMGRGG